jgi:hypothetical protein
MPSLPDEHDDDLEPEVIEGAEIETETYDDAHEDDVPDEKTVVDRARQISGPTEAEEEPADDEDSDTI